ncbi:hypothetical protein Y5W_02085 [Alcanivorax sp. 521-1]|uniref:DUF1425 domain-containing protein n=1 Tax=Alloalcanivorax profundimaris TaxID=2735259 RepID=A0ABS0ARM9_9GAMM|nr:hypothetical protein [Alloalcanivorax profundimaris]MBF5056791.1 hypothetical protein [Alloalcanivorax profundimaris]MBM1143093.1 hypothetical protein [Alcanivorax sp. ZXX171]
MTAKPLLISALLVGAALVAGCQSGMSKKEYQQRTEQHGYNTVLFTDYDLNRNFKDGLVGPNKVIRLTSTGHGIQRTDTGTSQVWVELRNHTDYDYQVEARTRFYTEGGMPTDADPVWRRLTVPANGNAVYREKSVGTERLQYRVEVRQTR